MGYLNATRCGETVYVWERDQSGKRVVKTFPAIWDLYYRDENGTHQTIDGFRASYIQAENREEHNKIISFLKEKNIPTYESDIPPEIKVLHKYYDEEVSVIPHTTFFDIEVFYDKEIGFSSPSNPYGYITSIVLYHEHKNHYVVIAVPPETLKDNKNSTEKIKGNLTNCLDHASVEVKFFEDERGLLLEFLKQIQDSDVISGWNSDFFDLPYVAKRIELVLGKNGLHLLNFTAGKRLFDVTFSEIEVFGNKRETVTLTGRTHYDYLQLFKKYMVQEQPSYKLDYIGSKFLDISKLEYQGSLIDLYNNDFETYVRYNIRDVEILHKLEEQFKFIPLSTQMYTMSGGLPIHVQGTLKLAELAIIKYAHEHGIIVNDVREQERDSGIQGAFVLNPKKGMHEWIFSIDITSLYPSVIRSINISPDTLVGSFKENVRAWKQIFERTNAILTFVDEKTGEEISKPASEWRDWLLKHNYSVSGYGVVYSQEHQGIIPSLLTDWFNKRKMYNAKLSKAQNKEEEDYFDRLQYIYKIKLNSLYGALTNPYFRFYDLRHGESTTGTGRQILLHQAKKTNELLGGEYELGEYVLYGDTDSVYASCKHLLDPKNTEEQQFEQALELANKTAEQVNQTFNDFVKDAFCIQSEEFLNIVKTAREVVARRGIFIEKKRYVLFVVDMKGKRVEELKAMGVDIKRTSLPETIKNQLKDFIKQFLKTNDWNAFARSIIDLKEQLMETDEWFEMGINTGVKGVEKYTADYNAGFRKNIPYHVAASILYNILRERNGDKESPMIASGSKIRVFFTNSPVEGFFNAIAIPTDIDYIPQWVKDFVNQNLNREKQISRIVDGPVDNIIGAIGKRTPAKRDLLINNLFTIKRNK